jgi:hypothetical protein
LLALIIPLILTFIHKYMMFCFGCDRIVQFIVTCISIKIEYLKLIWKLSKKIVHVVTFVCVLLNVYIDAVINGRKCCFWSVVISCLNITYFGLMFHPFAQGFLCGFVWTCAFYLKINYYFIFPFVLIYCTTHGWEDGPKLLIQVSKDHQGTYFSPSHFNSIYYC